MCNMTLSRLQLQLKPLEVPRDDDINANGYVTFDTRPLPPSRRTYGPWQFVGLWIVTGSYNISGWTTGSSLISLGLNVWQSMLIVIISNVILGVMCVVAGAPGAKWHVGFPIMNRSFWGMWGSAVPLAFRIFLSFIWTSTNTWWGGQCVRTLIGAISPSFVNLNKPLAGGTMQLNQFVAYILFILMCLPLVWLSPERYKIPFTIATISVIPCVFALLIWFMVQSGGGGSLLADVSGVSGVKQATGGHLGWMFVLGLTSNIGGAITHMFSQTDYTRYARQKNDQVLAQLIMVPLGAIVNGAIGIICTSCANKIFPETTKLLWQPFDVLAALQAHYDNSPKSRAAVAVASIAFIFACFGITVASNMVVAGIDLAATFPRYFNIRRGAYTTLLIAIVCQPWQLYNGATNFLSVVGGYSVFLAPFLSINFADYYVVRKRNLKLTDLYDFSDRSIYWFTYGVNWRAAVAWLMGVWLVMPGYVQHIRTPKVELRGWSQIYYLTVWVGFIVPAAVYLALDRVWPIENRCDVDDRDYFGTFEEKVQVVDGRVEEGIDISSEVVRVDVKGHERL